MRRYWTIRSRQVNDCTRERNAVLHLFILASKETLSRVKKNWDTVKSSGWISREQKQGETKPKRAAVQKVLLPSLFISIVSVVLFVLWNSTSSSLC